MKRRNHFRYSLLLLSAMLSSGAKTWIIPSNHGLGDTVASSAETQQTLTACQLKAEGLKKKKAEAAIEACMLEKGYSSVSAETADHIAAKNQAAFSGMTSEADMTITPYEIIWRELEAGGHSTLLEAVKLAHADGYQVSGFQDFIIFDTIPEDGQAPIKIMLQIPTDDFHGQSVRFAITIVEPPPQNADMANLAFALSTLNSQMVQLGTYVMWSSETGPTPAFRVDLPENADAYHIMTALSACESYHKQALGLYDLIKQAQ